MLWPLGKPRATLFGQITWLSECSKHVCHRSHFTQHPWNELWSAALHSLRECSTHPLVISTINSIHNNSFIVQSDNCIDQHRPQTCLVLPTVPSERIHTTWLNKNKLCCSLNSKWINKKKNPPHLYTKYSVMTYWKNTSQRMYWYCIQHVERQFTDWRADL